MILLQKKCAYLMALLLIVLLGGSFWVLYNRNVSDTATDSTTKLRQNSGKTGQGASNRAGVEGSASQFQKRKSRSVKEWVTWLHSEGGWQNIRDGVARIKGDRQAFKEIGICDEEYDEIFGGVSRAIWAVWGGSPDRIYTEGDTTICIYDGNLELEYVYGNFMSNLTRNLEGIAAKKKRNGITTEPVDPLLLEAVVEICRKEPVLRNFGLAKLETSFQDVVQDGKSIFRVVEKLYDAEGNIVTQNEYMSHRIPEPYNAELWIEEEK